MASTNGSALAHSYYPLGVVIPGYAPNTMDALELVSYFGLGCGLVLVPTYALIQSKRPDLRSWEVFAALWFVLCGFIHTFFEGYFAYNFKDMASKLDLFGQLWKEYSLSDSRYLTQDSFLVPMESVTAFLWGPISFFIAYAIVTGHPLRHSLQIIVSVGQIYGDILYYATCTFTMLMDQKHYCRPENYYFWAYYFLCNAFWIVIPGALVWQSIGATKQAFAQLQSIEKAKKGK
ncbi:unnamed protein product [Clonostachys rosea]|uniref:EXPERA domain-containing protein n=1 Tax=Bionectria ochroleuca TaxID=29856 RepID=A0ABY6UVP4_BIOOC|nr:unnamed protein product [Clonostachys rosea]